MVSLTFPYSEVGGGHDYRKQRPQVSKALQGDIPKVSVYLMENRDIQSLQSEMFFFALPFSEGVRCVPLFLQGFSSLCNCSLGEGTVYRG